MGPSLPTPVRFRRPLSSLSAGSWIRSERELLDTCLAKLADRQPAHEVAAVLRAGYVDLRIHQVVTGLPRGAERAHAATEVLSSVRVELARDVMASRLVGATR